MLAVSPETEALILAKATEAGKSPDEFLRALVTRSAPVAAPRGKPDIARMRALAAEAAALPLLDPRSEKEITDEGWGM
jgi:hypothetical protein